MLNLDGQRVLVTGGTGSLGHALVRRLLSGECGRPDKVVVFSRDEAKQHYMRLEFLQHTAATDEIIYERARQVLRFHVGDVRDFDTLLGALRQADLVFHAAALKQVPVCEYFPFEAVQTNVIGARNLVHAVRHHDTPVKRVVGISTDKACKPVNVMGMTKALQERLLIEANLECDGTDFLCVRYGNVIVSRGSVVPLFVQQIRAGGPVTVTLPDMTRFLLSLDGAVDTVLAAAGEGARGETYIPRVPAARVVDMATALMQLLGQQVPITFTGVRPGEKIHEIMVSEEECFRTGARGKYFAIQPVLPELRDPAMQTGVLAGEYSSMQETIDVEAVQALLAAAGGAVISAA